MIVKLALLILGAVSLCQAIPQSKSIKYTSNSPLNTYGKAAVASNVPKCAQIGSDILKYKNGSAVDAAISILICEGVTSSNSMGLGGGFMMNIYDAQSDKVEFLIARERAPALANATMFQGNASLTSAGGLAVAVPGAVLGFWEAHQKYGRAAWKDLIEPSIKLCTDGYVSNQYDAGCLKRKEKEIRADPILSEINIDPITDKLLGEGDVIKQPRLAKTLRALADAENAADLFYKGEMAEQLAAEIQQHGGIVTAQDFANYKVKWTESHRAEIDNMTVYTSPPPGSGIMLTFMLNVLKGLVPAENDVILCQRFVETLKFAFAKRAEIADSDFIDTSEVIANLTSGEYINHVRSLIRDDKTYDDPEHYGAKSWLKTDAGTGHVSVLAPDGSAVAVTASINDYFGAKFASPSTGIVLNNQMDDFGSPAIVNIYNVPPSPKNFIEPNKRPASSMVPTIVLDENRRVRLIAGSSAGTAIPTSTAYVMALHLWNGYNVKEAVDAYRLYHQLFPSYISAESVFPKEILDDLAKFGHNYIFKDENYRGANGANVIATDDAGVITANADYRREGASAGF